MTKLPCPLDPYARHMTSEYDEDGIIDVLIQHLDPPKYFVEFGCHPTQCNCLALVGRWPGLFMDGGVKKSWGDFAKQEFITPANVNELFDKYGVPQEIGVLSIDVDGQDLWIWQAINRKATIVVIEYNGPLGPEVSLTIPRDDTHVWDGTTYYGASLAAFVKLGEQKGYILVHANGQNAFFVLRELVTNASEFQYSNMWRTPKANHKADKQNRPFVEF